MSDRIWDRATVVAVIGLIVMVWFQLRGEIQTNTRVIADARVETLEAITDTREKTLEAITDAREKTLEAIIDLGREVAAVDKATTVVETVVLPLVPKIEETIRNTDANRDDIERLERLIKALEGSEP